MRPLRTLAATALALAALSGCSDESTSPTETSSTPTESRSPTASPTPETPEEPALPDAATKATKAGARAFITYYWDLINYAQVTGDVKTLRRVSARGCDGCRAGIHGIRDLYAEGGYLVGGRYSVAVLKLEPLDGPAGSTLFEALLRADNEAQVTHHGDGSTERSRTGSRSVAVATSWSADGWLMEVMDPR